MPCIRAWLQPCRWRQSIQGFSPRCLPPCQVRETIGELLGPLDQSRLHRVRRYVFPMLDEALPTLHARLGEATLPDLSPMAAFRSETSSGLSTSPAFTGFAAMYSRCLMKLCRHSTRVSEKPRCQTSPQWPHSFFKRYENPPLTNCMALSTVMPSPTVTNKCRWSGITTKSWSRNFLAAT